LTDPIIIGLICLAGVILCLLTGMWIAVGVGVVAVVVLYSYDLGPAFISRIAWVVGNSWNLAALPLFVVMGEILLHSGASEKIYRGAGKWLAWTPGGLLHSNIASCAMFAAISGSSVATAATIGTMAIPSLKKRHYDRRLILGSLAAGGTLGILIPPSITMIVYGSIGEVSIGRLFAGGMLPGIMLSAMFMVYIGIRVVQDRQLTPKEEAFSLRALVLSFKDLWPIIILMGIVLGSIFTGFATPTEAAALGATGAIFIALGLRRLNWQILRESLMAAVTTTCMCLFIIITATMLGSSLARLGTAKALAAWVTGLTVHPTIVILLLSLIYILLGCVMEGLSIVVVTTPIILPAVVAIGGDPVWFGVLLVVLVELGLLTPPVGVNLFVIQGISGDSLGEVLKGTIPFFLLMVAGLSLMIVFPSIVLWLPHLFFGS